MKKLFGILIVVFLLGIILLTGCRPPEVEGIVVNMNNGLYDKALELAKDAVKKYPANPEAWFLLGKLQARQENYVEMNEAFNKSLELSPTFEAQIKQIRFDGFATNYNSGIKNYYKKAQDEQDPVKKKELFKKAGEKFLNAHLADPLRSEP